MPGTIPLFRMAHIKSAFLTAIAITLVACNRQPTAEKIEAPSASPSGPASANAGIRAAQDLAKSGAVDEAAAKLMALRAQAAEFNQAQAAQYRDALADAYSRALEAARKGDPKAQAALQMIRAAGPK